LTPNVVTYYLLSSVLGQVTEELDGTGIKKQGFVYAGGKVLAVTCAPPESAHLIVRRNTFP